MKGRKTARRKGSEGRERRQEKGNEEGGDGGGR